MTLLRAVRLVGHLLLSALSLGWFFVTRRGAELVFTHAPDVDSEGRDRQMGPLIEGLNLRGRPFVEVILVPLSGGLLATLRRTRRPFLSHAAMLLCARSLMLVGRDRTRARGAVGLVLLRLLRPRAIYLIDESGSGQLLVRAARLAGIRTHGIQHGDFMSFPYRPEPGRPEPGRAFEVEPVDRFWVWSPWFRERLLSVSPVYDAANTAVSGRLRFAAGDEDTASMRTEMHAETVRVLLLADGVPEFAREVEPFVQALRAATGIELRVRPHPACPAPWPAELESGGSLAADLDRAQVVIGVASSALLEALRRRRPCLGLATTSRVDPAGYVAAGLLQLVEVPAQVADRCRALAGADSCELETARETVWAGAPDDPVGAILGS